MSFLREIRCGMRAGAGHECAAPGRIVPRLLRAVTGPDGASGASAARKSPARVWQLFAHGLDLGPVLEQLRDGVPLPAHERITGALLERARVALAARAHLELVEVDAHF